MWKDFFYFSRTEKQAIFVLLILIGAVCCVDTGLTYYRQTASAAGDTVFEEQYHRFAATLATKDSIQAAQFAAPAAHQEKNRKTTVVLAPFDPNTADSLTFSRLGMPGWMTRNILRYRAKGGTFRKPEDFRKIYGLTDEQYTTLLPYIYISEQFLPKDTFRIPVHLSADRTDTLRTFKYPVGTIINLNTADTTELKMIPGIGSALARRIVGYRSRLGGYHQLSQLSEIELKPDELSSWFSIVPGETKRMNLNRVSIERLKAHPYVNFYQAKIIIEHRKKKGNLKRIEQLAFYEEFTPTDLERIEPYVSFE